MQRGLIVGLLVSLALNVFALGHWSGRALTAPLGQGPGGGDHDRRVGIQAAPFAEVDVMRLMRHLDKMPTKAREAFRREMRTNVPQLRENFRQAGDVRMEVERALRADTLDRAELDRLFADLDAIHETQRDIMKNTLLSAFEELSADERGKILDAIPRGRESHRMPGRRDDPMRRRPPNGDN